MTPDQLKPNIIVTGPIFAEPVKILTSFPLGGRWKLVGQGLRSNQVHDRVLTQTDLAQLEASPDSEPFDGDPHQFRLAVEAIRLGLAYEHDPYFSLSIARVDPLPHQLEAVYDYFLKQPRIRFLLADDPGAGKTIMAGLLIKELRIRGLVKRILIVTPAALTFQWQREMKDKFREQFTVIRSDLLRANYGSNPWQDVNMAITSVSWVSMIEDARESLLRSHWDLIIVDEAHKMSAGTKENPTMAYKLGKELSERTDHLLLMTATPHKGDPVHFTRFLELLDKDLYADVASLEEAMRRQSAPCYLRRVKEALVTFPDPETGKSKLLFTKRIVRTPPFDIDGEELDLYDSLTRYVERQIAKADDSPRGRAMGFTMAMLQRRLASSVYAVRRSLERMRKKRQDILEDPEGYKQELIKKKLPEDFEELDDEGRQEILDELEGLVVDVDPAALKEEIEDLGKLIDQAKRLEGRDSSTKLTRLRKLLQEQGIFNDPKMKLLIFTEHKDTLDYLTGDGREGRPMGKLREWGLTVTTIHGGMKVGDRNTPGSRIYAEREFREDCQVLVATEAAGEGINLQFCWFLINYDIPWNPTRLEQRMGRIHRYGQEKDCLIINFVAQNTREGRVMAKLFERIAAIEDDLDPNRTGKVFNVLGDVLPANLLEKMLRDMYAHNQTEQAIIDRIVNEVDPERFRNITQNALEGLAKKELNLGAIIGKSAEARERRLVPEVIEDFFQGAAPIAGINSKAGRGRPGIFTVGRIPRNLWPTGERLEPRFGKLGHEYKHITFDKAKLTDDPTLEWVTPGHALFEVVREDCAERTARHLTRGSVFFDLNRADAYRVDLFNATISDGLGQVLHRKLFALETRLDGTMHLRQPTLFLDCAVATGQPTLPPDVGLPDKHGLEAYLADQALGAFLAEIQAERGHELDTVARHMEISLGAIIDKANHQLAELMDERDRDPKQAGIEGRIKMVDDRLFELNHRLEKRRSDLISERQITLGDVRHLGRAWILPHPKRDDPEVASMVSDANIERIAVQAAIAYEESQGWKVQSVEADNRGFDLISRKPHPEDPETAIGVRFIEVKGRAGVGDIALTDNEFKTAQRLKHDYWLYVVYDCAGAPKVHRVQNPARLEWKPVVQVEHYRLSSSAVAAGKDS